MASLITNIIPKQNFEIVLDKLGVILLEELTKQKMLQSFESDFGIFIERQEPYDKSEDVVISISLNTIPYNGHTQNDSQGNASFFIDIYTTGVESISKSGNDNSRQKIHLFAGMIRYIFSSTKYKTLGLPTGFIGGKYVENIQFDDNYGNQDGSFIRFCRVTLSVRIQENQEMWESLAFSGNDTTIKLNLTEQGYKLIFNT
jgi:hypothetical protein